MLVKVFVDFYRLDQWLRNFQFLKWATINGVYSKIDWTIRESGIEKDKRMRKAIGV